QILGTLIGSLYFLFGVESRSQQFLYLSAMTYGINDVHFIFATMLSEGDSIFLPVSIYVLPVLPVSCIPLLLHHSHNYPADIQQSGRLPLRRGWGPRLWPDAHRSSCLDRQ
ncbi:unnamed protein product, partial [Ixodes persulcatus]